MRRAELDHMGAREEAIGQDLDLGDARPLAMRGGELFDQVAAGERVALGGERRLDPAKEP